MRRPLVIILINLLVAALLVELAGQVLLWRTARAWDTLRRDAGHYYQASDDPILVYELKQNYEYTKDGRRLEINRYGIRDDQDILPAAPRKIALLGDSVAFGQGISQDQTLDALLQQRIDPGREAVRVLNLAVPGYNLRELLEFLKIKNAIYRVTDVVYVMNPNDFSWRDTIYEGADNGLYRMYRRPLLASPFLVGKAIYRWHKARSLSMKYDMLVSVPWYRWMFRGNRERGYQVLDAMKRYADDNRIAFSVLLLPAGCAYRNGLYELADMYDDVYAFLKRSQIESIDARGQFAPHATEYCDQTDHLTAQGNRALAALLAERIGSQAR